MILRIVIAFFVVAGLVLLRGVRREKAPPRYLEFHAYTGGPTGSGGEESGDRSPLKPIDPRLSGSAAKKLGEEE
jgi:hypothetical protein